MNAFKMFGTAKMAAFILQPGNNHLIWWAENFHLTNCFRLHVFQKKLSCFLGSMNGQKWSKSLFLYECKISKLASVQFLAKLLCFEIGCPKCHLSR